MTRFFFLIFTSSLLLFLVMNCSYKNVSKKENIHLSGQLMKAGQYCGGAPPSPEFLKEIRTPRPLANYALFIKKGKENQLNAEVVQKILTDDSGHFQIELPQGDYILLSEHQLDRNIFENKKDIKILDQEALESWWKKGLFSFSSDAIYEKTFQEKCSLPLGIPHLRYIGPMAP